MWSRSEFRQKQQHKESPSSMAASTLVASFLSFSQSDRKRWKSATSLPPSIKQMMLIGTKHDPHATEWMDIAIAEFIFNNGLPISLVECAKFNKLIQSARHIPPKYTPPYRKKMAGPLLDNIYQSTYDEQMRLLLKESQVFGIALFGNGATIQKVPMIFFLGSSPNNPFALLDIVDCTSEMAKGGEKDAKYIAGLFKPLISQIEQTKDPNNQKTDHQGVVDLVLFDGASNVQNAGKLVSITYPTSM
jgi:hypothetical protein